jgi:hypothetical protein
MNLKQLTEQVRKQRESGDISAVNISGTGCDLFNNGGGTFTLTDGDEVLGVVSDYTEFTANPASEMTAARVAAFNEAINFGRKQYYELVNAGLE